MVVVVVVVVVVHLLPFITRNKIETFNGSFILMNEDPFELCACSLTQFTSCTVNNL